MKKLRSLRCPIRTLEIILNGCAKRIQNLKFKITPNEDPWSLHCPIHTLEIILNGCAKRIQNSKFKIIPNENPWSLHCPMRP